MVTLIDLSDSDLGEGPFDQVMAERLGVRYLLHAAGVEEEFPKSDRPVFVCMADHNPCPLIPPGRSTAHGIVLVIDPANPSHQAIAQWHREATRPDLPVVVVEMDALVETTSPTVDRPVAGRVHQPPRGMAGMRGGA